MGSSRPGTKFLPWALIAVYAASRVLQVWPRHVPMLAVVVLHVLPAALFALIHGARIYSWRGMIAFFSICLVVGNIFENLGVRTGFPFGHYYFTDLMGPKILSVPILLGIAYLGMAYLAWTLAGLILGGSRIVTTPLVAAFIMTAWDLSMDPVWSTILHAWIWPEGGAYFGVPVTNFFGWYLTVFVFYQAFAFYLRGRTSHEVQLTRGDGQIAVIFYVVSAAGNLLLAIPRSGARVVADPAGVMWRVSDITAACALVSIFTMGAFALMAWARVPDN